MTDLTLTVERIISAPQERVFDAWLDPRALRRFMTPGPGVTCPEATVDARVGGRFALTMTSGDERIPHGGTYLEITPHSRIVFTWESPVSAAGSTVTLDFSPRDGGTHLRLSHVTFRDEETRDNHQNGWGSILAALATACE